MLNNNDQHCPAGLASTPALPCLLYLLSSFGRHEHGPHLDGALTRTLCVYCRLWILPIPSEVQRLQQHQQSATSEFLTNSLVTMSYLDFHYQGNPMSSRVSRISNTTAQHTVGTINANKLSPLPLTCRTGL